MDDVPCSCLHDNVAHCRRLIFSLIWCTARTMAYLSHRKCTTILRLRPFVLLSFSFKLLLVSNSFLFFRGRPTLITSFAFHFLSFRYNPSACFFAAHLSQVLFLRLARLLYLHLILKH
ncbi:hypothetical protein P692DRAFT_20341632 [Suillus brevipes Sb2]|nr:hypothetical protein P692DRAFT_20341632 [Suillus brevipes Sb2]